MNLFSTAKLRRDSTGLHQSTYIHTYIHTCVLRPSGLPIHASGQPVSRAAHFLHTFKGFAFLPAVASGRMSTS